MNTLLLIDGNAIMHRAYHALPPFKTKEGLPTNAIYGFITILNKAIQDFHPDNLIICFDTPVPTFRKKMFKEYQSHRPKLETELIVQFPVIKEGLDTAGIKHVEVEGYEADDLIGTISRNFSKKGSKVLILSGDKDILQLADENISVVTPQIGYAKGKIYDPAEVKKRFGIDANQIPDFKALMGDQSDNYKGAKGIGPKTAAKLLQRFTSISNIYKHINDIDEKIRIILKEYKENVLLSHQLATIMTDLDVEVDLKNIKFSGYKPGLKDFLEKYQMTTLVRRFFTAHNKLTISKPEKKKKKDENQMGLF